MLTTKFATLDLPATFGSLAGAPADNTALAAALTTKLNKAGGTVTGALTSTANGADSAPALHLTGTLHTGGTATTTKPQFLIEPAGTSSDHWHPSGTLLGVNAPEGFGGMLLEAQRAAGTAFSIDAEGRIRCGNGGAPLQLRGVYGNYTLTQFGDGAMVASHGTTAPYVGVGDVAYRTMFCGASAGGTEQMAVIEQRNGTIAQRLAIFNTHISSSNREFVELGFIDNIAHLWTAKGASWGDAREFILGYDSTERLRFDSSGTTFTGSVTHQGDFKLHDGESTTLFSISVGGEVMLSLDSLPPTDPGVEGQLWRDGNTVKISTGI